MTPNTKQINALHCANFDLEVLSGSWASAKHWLYRGNRGAFKVLRRDEPSLVDVFVIYSYDVQIGVLVRRPKGALLFARRGIYGQCSRTTDRHVRMLLAWATETFWVSKWPELPRALENLGFFDCRRVA